MTGGILGILVGAGLLTNLGLTLSPAEQMALHALYREQREAIRLREAHAKRFEYVRIGDALTRPNGQPAMFGRLYHDELKRDTPVPHLRQIKRDLSRYTGADIRKLEARKGCGHISKRRKPGQYVTIDVPWADQRRIVGFDVVVGDNGKPHLTNLGIYRYSGRLRRLCALEAQYDDFDWQILVQRVTDEMKAQAAALKAA